MEVLMKFNIKVEIKEFESQYQKSVEELVSPIQRLEFGVPITAQEQPDLMAIEGTFKTGVGNFWVAICDSKVVGTIGLVDIENNEVALKKMFVHKDFRGKEHGVSTTLMAQAQNWCREKGVQRIYLGTVSQMHAAHRFYEKNGFVPVLTSELPPNFPIVHVDTKFYKCEL